MRSIRRTSIAYLLVLLVLALGGVSLLVDRTAEAALRTREDASTQRIQQSFDLRQQEARTKFDTEIRSEAKALQRVLKQIQKDMNNPKDANNAERAKAQEADAKEFSLGASIAAAVGTGQSSRIPSLWANFEAPRTLARYRDALKAAFQEDEHAGYFQIHVVIVEPTGLARSIGAIHAARQHAELPLDVDALHHDVQFEERFETIELPDNTSFRRVIIPTGGLAPLWLSPWPFRSPGPSLGGSRPWNHGYATRIYIQVARPLTELTARLTENESERDEQLAAVQRETRSEVTQLRSRLALIGGVAFVALLAGVWVVIGRGLAPVGKLSYAVSQVSEKDFTLPHDGKDLPAELAPIHARINQTLDLLRRAFSREKQSVADISHELRTPIASLMAIFDVTLRKQRSPEQYRTALEDCRVITKQLGQLVERIMTLASLDAGTAQTVTSRIDATEVALGCAAVIRPLAESHGLRFEIEANEPVELDTDPDKLREVLINLLHNAVEYNQTDGHVSLSVRRDVDKAVFEVADSGIGMTPDVQERIFERFYRADASRHATGVHAGLGLSIVKEYVERLNGTITVESAPEVGTTFRVTLPAPELQEVEREAEPVELAS